MNISYDLTAGKFDDQADILKLSQYFFVRFTAIYLAGHLEYRQRPGHHILPHPLPQHTPSAFSVEFNLCRCRRSFQRLFSASRTVSTTTGPCWTRYSHLGCIEHQKKIKTPSLTASFFGSASPSAIELEMPIFLRLTLVHHQNICTYLILQAKHSPLQSLELFYLIIVSEISIMSIF
jgi:hypothetical protein